jgi:hypothetical protein
MEDAVIDVSRLMQDVRERVARKEAQGLYGPDAGEGLYGEDLAFRDLELVDPMDRLRARAFVAGRRETMFSQRRIIGPGLTFARRALVKLISPFIGDLVMQTNAFHLETVNYLRRLEETLKEEGRAREELEQRLQRLEREANGPASR